MFYPMTTDRDDAATQTGGAHGDGPARAPVDRHCVPREAGRAWRLA
jgi:hypothetical protein